MDNQTAMIIASTCLFSTDHPVGAVVLLILLLTGALFD